MECLRCCQKLIYYLSFIGSVSLFIALCQIQSENISDISDTSTLVSLSVNLRSFGRDAYRPVEIEPPPSEGYLHNFCFDFEFNSCLVEMVEVAEIFSDDVIYHPYKVNLSVFRLCKDF